MTLPFQPRLTLSLFRLEDFSRQIHFPSDQLEEIIEDQSHKIHIFVIEKLANSKIKKRVIYNPSVDYKIALKRINKYLLSRASLFDGVCGGVKHKNLRDMTKPHCGKEAIYAIDLQDFYPSIDSKRVSSFFCNCKCSSRIAELLTRLTTFDNQLPQGFPTSTALANLIASKLDYDQLNIAQKCNLSRTRWIDDIVFSGRIKDLECAIHKINSAVLRNGFRMNKEKTNFMRRRNQPAVVGLCIDKHNPYIPEGLINRVRETILIAEKYGVDKAKAFYDPAIGNRSLIAHLHGLIVHIKQFNPVTGLELEQALARINQT